MNVCVNLLTKSVRDCLQTASRFRFDQPDVRLWSDTAHSGLGAHFSKMQRSPATRWRGRQIHLLDWVGVPEQ
jgi:hypothetical protein